MVSFFWKKGLYFNNSLYIYIYFKKFSLLKKQLFGLNFLFCKLITYRLENTYTNYFNNWTILHFFYIYFYSSYFFPIFLVFKSQLKLNVYFTYLIKTTIGVSHYFNKPISQKTRSKTFLKKKKKFTFFL